MKITSGIQNIALNFIKPKRKIEYISNPFPPLKYDAVTFTSSKVYADEKRSQLQQVLSEAVENKIYYTYQELADMINVSKGTIHNLIKNNPHFYFSSLSPFSIFIILLE